MKINKVVRVIGVIAICQSASYVHAGSSELVLEKCRPLLDAVGTALDQRKKKTAIEATGITAGGSLSEAACIDNLMSFEFDSFMKIPSLNGLLGGIFEGFKKDVRDSLTQMACDFSDELKAQTDTFLSCTANMTVDLNMAAGIPTPELQSCLNTGMDGYSFDYSADQSFGTGTSSLERRSGITLGDLTNSAYQSQSSSNLLDTINQKVEALNSLKQGEGQ